MSVHEESLQLPHHSVKDGLLHIAKYICVREARSVETRGRYMVEWQPVDTGIFATPIWLEQVMLTDKFDPEGSFEVAQASFHVGGDDEAAIVIPAKIEDNLNDDPLAPDILHVFKKAYTTHPHALCLRSIRHKRLKELERAKIMQKETMRPFKVTDKRR